MTIVYWMELSEEVKNSKLLYFEIIVAFISIILGILGYWSFSGAVSVYFTQVALYLIFAAIWSIKKIRWKNILIFMIAVIILLAIIVINYYLLSNVLKYYFEQQIRQSVLYFLVLIIFLVIKEFWFYKNIDLKTLKNEEKTGGSDIGMYRTWPLWIISGLVWYVSLFTKYYYNSIALLVIFVIIITTTNIFYDADRRLVSKEMNKG